MEEAILHHARGFVGREGPDGAGQGLTGAGVWEELSMVLGVFIFYDTSCHIPQNETTRLLVGSALLNVNIASQIWLN